MAGQWIACRRRGWLCGVWVYLVAFAICGAAWGQQALTKPDLPRGWVTVARQGDAKCIGDLRTALCTLKTLLACSVRKDRHLCALARGIDDAAVTDRDIDVSIRIRDLRNKLEFQFWDVENSADDSMIPANEIMLHTRERQCAATRRSCAGVPQKPYDFEDCAWCRVPMEPFGYSLAWQGDHWIVTYVVYERGD